MSGFYILAITEVLYFDLGRGSVLVDRPRLLLVTVELAN